MLQGAGLLPLFLCFLLVTLALAQRQPGPCPDRPSVAAFDLNKFVGSWYEQARYNPFEGGSYCVVAEYSPYNNTDGTLHFVVNNTGCSHPDCSTGRDIEAVGDGYQPVTTGRNASKLQVGFPATRPFYGPYWVVALVRSNQDGSFTILGPEDINDDANDEYYAAGVLTCNNEVGNKHVDYVDILARDVTISPDLLSRIYKRFEAIGVDMSIVTKDDNSNCLWP